LKFEWFIAKRYFKARRRSEFLSFISTFTIIGIALGTTALILTLSILDGFELEIKEKVIGFTSHIQVEGYQNKSFPNYRESLQKVKSTIPNVKSIVPYFAREGMIRSHEEVDGILLKGIDPTIDISMTKNLILKGRYLNSTAGNIPELVMGKKLANKLSVDIGDKVVIFGLPRGSTDQLQPRAMQGVVVGIYESGMAEYDDIYVYTNIENAQNLFQLGAAATGYDILVNDLTKVDETARDVQKELGYPHYARTVFQSYHNLFSWVELQKKMSPIMLSLIIIVATVNIIGTILMFVLEKTSAVGVLKSLGASPKSIGRIFLLQGMTIASSGIILGNILAFLIAWIQFKFRVMSLPSDIYYMTSVPIELRLQNFLLVTLAAYVLCLLTTILPARAASRLNTVDILRFH
jgi:lipoprotein-releasing system permease protein